MRAGSDVEEVRSRVQSVFSFIPKVFSGTEVRVLSLTKYRTH